VTDVVACTVGHRKFAFNGPEMLEEIAREIDILLALRCDIVLSHVIIPADLPAYRAILRERGLRYMIFVLQPQYAAVVARAEQRRVFPSPTAEEWIRHFYEAVGGFVPDDDVVIFDNSEVSPGEAAVQILDWYQKR
jgi:hypothetical protein